jgi:hypothetical protein
VEKKHSRHPPKKTGPDKLRKLERPGEYTSSMWDYGEIPEIV